MHSLTVVNAETATFECTFGRGCEGLCCKNGRPSVTAYEQERIEAALPKVLARLRPEARRVVEKQGWLTDRTKIGLPMVRVVKSWCVFFNQGCVLHSVGEADGSFAKIKPIQCVMFPLEPNDDGTWYVRQWGIEGEQWDIFCLNPANSTKKAIDTLAPEIAVAEELGVQFQWGHEPRAQHEPHAPIV
jgi:Fe-S-cluster containining protein